MTTVMNKKFRLGLLGLLLLLLTCGVYVFSTQRLAAARASGSIGIVCAAGGPTFNLQTTGGYISTPDGNSVFMWSFAPASGPFQFPGPVLCVDEGDSVTVNLTNTLPEPVSIVFPGQSGITSSGGSPGLFAAEAAASGGSVSYTFTAGEPGTYLYESGSNPFKQVQMGLFGALIVRPSLGSNYAYNDPRTEFDPNREFLLVLHDMDPALHQAVELGQTYDITTKHDHYWTVNGRSFPDVISDNFVAWLPNQPYGGLVQVEASPDINDLPALIRYANAGMSNHPFHPHGNHLLVIARDGRLLRGAGGEDASMAAFTKTIGSGQTYDLLFRWVNTDAWEPNGNPVQVQIPGLQNLVFMDGATFYSGSPYLGYQGELPPTVTSYNQCGEFYFPWHSHALNEFQNFDEGFGGLATLLRVDPPGGCP